MHKCTFVYLLDGAKAISASCPSLSWVFVSDAFFSHEGQKEHEGQKDAKERKERYSSCSFCPLW